MRYTAFSYRKEGHELRTRRVIKNYLHAETHSIAVAAHFLTEMHSLAEVRMDLLAHSDKTVELAEGITRAERY